MKLNSVSARESYTWIQQGIWLFKQNPLGFFMLVFIYVFIAQLAVLVPILGVFAVLILTPTLSVGFLTACRQAIVKEPLRPMVYLIALRSDPIIRKRILQLGLIYTILILILSIALSAIVDFEALLPLVTSDQPLTAETLHQIYELLAIGGLLYIPVAMLMWFSPILIAWTNMPVAQALFSSFIACWRNRGAFLVYIAFWIVVLIIIPMAIGAGLNALNLEQVASFIVAPISMAGLTVMHCSFYATWKACFLEDAAPSYFA